MKTQDHLHPALRQRMASCSAIPRRGVADCNGRLQATPTYSMCSAPSRPQRRNSAKPLEVRTSKAMPWSQLFPFCIASSFSFMAVRSRVAKREIHLR